MLMWEKIPGCPRFSILQAMESWAEHGNEAREGACSHSQWIHLQGCWAPNLLSKHIPLHSHRVESREVLLTPLQATDPGGTITMVMASGRSFTRQIDTEDIALQETNPATPGQLVLGNWSIIKLHNALFCGTTVTRVTMHISNYFPVVKGLM